MEGLEPPRLAAPDPKSGAATNYATSGRCLFCRCGYHPDRYRERHIRQCRLCKLFPRVRNATTGKKGAQIYSIYWQLEQVSKIKIGGIFFSPWESANRTRKQG